MDKDDFCRALDGHILNFVNQETSISEFRSKIIELVELLEGGKNNVGS